METEKRKEVEVEVEVEEEEEELEKTMRRKVLRWVATSGTRLDHLSLAAFMPRDHAIDYNFVMLCGRTHDELHEEIARGCGDEWLTPVRVARLLAPLTTVGFTGDSYGLDWLTTPNDTLRRVLSRSPGDAKIFGHAVEYTTWLSSACILFSVLWLKMSLPLDLLPDVTPPSFLVYDRSEFPKRTPSSSHEKPTKSDEAPKSGEEEAVWRREARAHAADVARICVLRRERGDTEHVFQCSDSLAAVHVMQRAVLELNVTTPRARFNLEASMPNFPKGPWSMRCSWDPL